jgi:hypothetical protein
MSSYRVFPTATRIAVSLLATGCSVQGNNDIEPPTRDDAVEVLNSALGHLSRAFPAAKDACLVTVLGSGAARRAEEVRIALSEIPAAAIPADRATTSERYGCADTLQLSAPVFWKVGRGNRIVYNASVFIDDLCGPLCGSQSVMRFAKNPGSGWAYLGTAPTGTDY